MDVIHQSLHSGGGLLLSVLVGLRLHHQVVHTLDGHIVGIMHVAFDVIVIDRIVGGRIAQINPVGHPPETFHGGIAHCQILTQLTRKFNVGSQIRGVFRLPVFQVRLVGRACNGGLQLLLPQVISFPVRIISGRGGKDHFFCNLAVLGHIE